MISKLLTQIKKHKFIAGILILAIAAIGYFGYNKIFNNSNVTRYVTAQVQKGSLTNSVSGTGYVSSLNQIDSKSKVSEEVISVSVSEGQEVKAGDLIIKLDAKNALKTVRDAEIALENAKLSLEKLKLQYDQLLRADTLNKNYEDGMTILSDLYDNYPQILNNLNDILFGTALSSVNTNNIEYYSSYDAKFNETPSKAKTLYDDLKILFPKTFDVYTQTKRGEGDLRDKAIQDSYNLVLKTAELIKISRDPVLNLQNNLVLGNSIHKYKTLIDAHALSLTNYSNTMDNYLKNLLAVVNAINTYKDSISSYPLDIKNQELNIKQKENALLDAKQKLDDYYVYAPFSGIITNITAHVGETVPAGTVATLITKNKIVEISLNEVDAAKVKVGQKAILTFDALPELTLTGQVAEIDAVGTVSQGVVNYTVKISFDIQDERIKPGMSVSAVIITEVKPDVLLVPNSAVKSQAGANYVEIVEGEDRSLALASNANGIILKNPPRRQPVEIGSANDEFTEIISGLKEGDVIIVRTIQLTSAQTTQTQQQSGGLKMKIPGL